MQNTDACIRTCRNGHSSKEAKFSSASGEIIRLFSVPHVTDVFSVKPNLVTLSIAGNTLTVLGGTSVSSGERAVSQLLHVTMN